MTDEERQDCPHGEPRGPRYCGLCRVEVLAAHGQWRRKWRYIDLTPTDATPMPKNFDDQVQRARARTVATHHHQPTLEDL